MVVAGVVRLVLVLLVVVGGTVGRSRNGSCGGGVGSMVEALTGASHSRHSGGSDHRALL